MTDPLIQPGDFLGVEGARPSVDQDGVPRCSYESCPSYDGKRCGLMGFRPDAICEPGVAEMARLLRARWAP